VPYWAAGILIVLAVLAVLAAVLYNRLVRDRNRVDGAWSDIDVQLQRRHDLIPQLVKAVDQYAKYERATIEAVTALRAEAMRTTDVEALGKAEEELSGGVRRLLALAEQYPDLKANENFLKLQANWLRPKTTCNSHAATTTGPFASSIPGSKPYPAISSPAGSASRHGTFSRSPRMTLLRHPWWSGSSS
jgi:hypothetical protein